MSKQVAFVADLKPNMKVELTRTEAMTLWHVSQWLWHPSVEPTTGLMYCDKRKPVISELWNPDLSNPFNLDAAIQWKKAPAEFWMLCARKQVEHECYLLKRGDGYRSDCEALKGKLIEAHMEKPVPQHAPCNELEEVTCKVRDMGIE